MSSFAASFINNLENKNLTGAPNQQDFCQQVDLRQYDDVLIVDRADVDNFIEDFVRLFRLSKRSIEYLIYTQNYLKSISIALENKFKSIEKEMQII